MQRDEVLDVTDGEKTDHSLPQPGEDVLVDEVVPVMNEVSDVTDEKTDHSLPQAGDDVPVEVVHVNNEVLDVTDGEKTDHSLPQPGDDVPVNEVVHVKNEEPNEDDTED